MRQLTKAALWAALAIRVALAQPEPFVWYGAAVPATDFPWYASLYATLPNELDTTLCGAMLVSNRHAITAAHCVVHQGEVLDDVLLFFQGSNRHYASAQVVLATQVIVHEAYDGSPFYHADIAIVRFDRDLIAEGTRPVQLAWGSGWSRMTDEGLVDIVGYGTTETGHIGYPLRSVSLPAISKSECVGESPYQWPIEYLHGDLCAGYYWNVHVDECSANGCPDSCQGDSGSPLFVDAAALADQSIAMPQWTTTATTSALVFGIVSRGEMPCGAGYRPGMYTNISMHHDWLATRIPSPGDGVTWPRGALYDPSVNDVPVDSSGARRLSGNVALIGFSLFVACVACAHVL